MATNNTILSYTMGDDVGRLVDSGQAEDRRMIRLVRKRPMLYARTNMPVASYFPQVKHLWQQVADKMGWSVAEVRRKWSHMRNSYSRHLRNEIHGARTSRGRMVSGWYLANELNFLRDHMHTDVRSSPYPKSITPSLLELSDLASSSPSPETVELKPFLGEPWFSVPQAHRVKLEDGEEAGVKSGIGFTPDENASYFQFFRGIFDDYRELSTRKQRLFLRRCLDSLHDLLDEEEEEGQSDALNLSASDAGTSNICKVESVVSGFTPT